MNTDRWNEQSLVDLCARVTSGGTPSRRIVCYYKDGIYPWVKTQELNDTWIEDTEEHITLEAIKKSSAKILPENTVLVAMYGATVGKLGLLRKPMSCNQACCALVADNTKANYRFIFYLLLQNRARLKSLATGAAQQNLSGEIIKSLRFSIPPLPEQRRIASILGNLDDQIENNRKMAKTLEAMAQAIFQSWFVDFDPVRAKMAGESRESICKRLKITPEILDLFPDRLVDSELGEIPGWWEIRSLDSIGNFLNGLAMQKFPSTGPDDIIPVIKISQLKTGNINDADSASCKLEPQYIVHNGDILFSWSGSLECVVWSGGDGALNQHLFKVSPKAGYPRWLCYFGVHHFLETFREIAAGKATTMGHIQRIHLTDAKLALPNSVFFDLASRPLELMFESQWKYAVAASTSSVIRDTLLPKLISGEYRLPDAEHFMNTTLNANIYRIIQ
jgi:type I restriction enzyme S subunit